MCELKWVRFRCPESGPGPRFRAEEFPPKDH